MHLRSLHPGSNNLLPETPRWLILHEETPLRGEVVLSKLRNKPIGHPSIIEEKNEIMGAIELEPADDGSWLALFKDGGDGTDKRFYLSLGIQFMQEMGGINMISYYAPTIFKESLGMSEERALFVGYFLQVWYVFASFLTWYIIDRVGCRRLFILMAIAMRIIMACEAACVALGGVSASIAAIFFVFLFEGCFSWGWQASTWVYPAEILPLKVRAKGASLAAASCFLGNFLVVAITPPALENIGYKSYTIFAVLNLVQAIISWAFYPETALIPLEQIDKLFISNEVEQPPKEGIHRFQYSVVRTADDVFHEIQRQHKLGKNVELGLKAESDTASSDKMDKSPVEHVEIK
ncbi:hypothetical protein N7478_011990 [Penicillium angulare]|uniref:uncharacterized protein n=1 Tax=Penicillium angulare TaxID=116970 RepID=UPI0025423A88|nr:uncharacterized protein N7478_011990 [Penicillium angulare]KAJ5261395.1 hypothetical protein N7478_011990 [Penicillium angulare]